jgi:hypothetical protein
MAQFGLSEVRLDDLGLDKIRQDFHHPMRKHRSIVSPAPDSHPANSERTGGGGVASEGYPKDKVVPAAGQTTLEAR